MTIRAQIELTNTDPDRLADDCKAVAALLEERNRSYASGGNPRTKPIQRDRSHLEVVHRA